MNPFLDQFMSSFVGVLGANVGGIPAAPMKKMMYDTFLSPEEQEDLARLTKEVNGG